MPIVKWDTIDGARGSASFRGWEIERKCRVTDLTPSPSILIDAVEEALADGGYSGIGAAYAHLPNTFLEEWQPSLVSGTHNTVDISFVFRQLVPEMTTDIGTSLSQETSCFDKDGKLVKVSYTPAGGTTKEQKCTFSKLMPESVIIVTRLETVSPGATSRAYVGRVNSGGWSRDPGAPARTWLCTSISGQNRGTGIFLTTYQFAFREETWDEKVFYIDPNTGRIPPDVLDNDQNAIKTVKKYKEANFNNLNLGA